MDNENRELSPEENQLRIEKNAEHLKDSEATGLEFIYIKNDGDLNALFAETKTAVRKLFGDEILRERS